MFQQFTYSLIQELQKCLLFYLANIESLTNPGWMAAVLFYIKKTEATQLACHNQRRNMKYRKKKKNKLQPQERVAVLRGNLMTQKDFLKDNSTIFNCCAINH